MKKNYKQTKKKKAKELTCKVVAIESSANPLKGSGAGCGSILRRGGWSFSPYPPVVGHKLLLSESSSLGAVPVRNTEGAESSQCAQQLGGENINPEERL